MDTRLQYEQTIAGKLQSLPIPDMQDAIWKRVKFQLDLDMPEDDGPDMTPPSPSGPGLLGWGLSILLVAFIAVFIIFKKEPSQNLPQNNATTKEELLTPAETPNAPPGTVKANDFNSNKSISNNAGALPSFLPTAGQDSAIKDQTSVNIPLLLDTTLKKSTQDLSQVKPSVDTIPVQGKKQRGVPGLSPDDFRIVPKKDSTNRQ